MDLSDESSFIQVSVIELESGEHEIGIFIPVLDKVLQLTPKQATDLAFLLMECADAIQPPFENDDESED